jgi:hypothetical protein
VFDGIIEVVSLVSNYRTQFNKILQEESYAALVKKMQQKSAQLEAMKDMTKKIAHPYLALAHPAILRKARSY